MNKTQTNPKVRQLRLSAWRKLEDHTTKKYISEHLGDKPTRDSVSKATPNTDPVTLLEWLTVILLLVLVAFSVFKAVPVAIAFADSYLAVAELPDYLLIPFRVAAVLAGAMLVSTGLIFTTMMAQAPHILQLQKDFAVKGNPFRLFLLEVLVPRMFTFLTYSVIVWLFLISSHGEGSYAMKFLPVIFEVVLAHLTIDVYNKKVKRNNEITLLLNAALIDWKKALNDRYSNATFLEMLYLEMREAIIYMKVGRGKTPNAWMLELNNDSVMEIITKEYLRLTSGMQFALNLTSEKIEREEIKAQVAERGQPLEQIAPPKNSHTSPDYPNGKWTVASLKGNFQQRGLNPDVKYTEKNLNQDYLGDCGAREAYREGAKFYFTHYQKG